MLKSSSYNLSMKKYGEYLARKSLKSTMQRDLIVNEFFKTKGHVSVDELHLKLRGAHSSIGLATVYRTLKILTDAGLAHARRFNDGFTRYERAAPDDKHHDHIVCLHCGLVEEFEDLEIEKLQKKIVSKHKFKMVDHKLEIYGYCKGCSAKRE